MSEYAVEICNEDTCEFIEQVDVFQTLDEAKRYILSHFQKLSDGQEYRVVCIDYDNEIEVGTKTIYFVNAMFGKV